MYIIVAVDSRSVGEFYLSDKTRNISRGIIHWECSWANSGTTKVYKNKSNAEKVMKRLTPLYYKYMTFSVRKIET